MKQVVSDFNRGAFIRQTGDEAELISVYGDVDIANEFEFRDVIDGASAVQRPIIVDLMKCTFIGSTGFHVLEDGYQRHAQGLTVIAPAHIRKLIDVVGLSHLLAPRASIEARS